MAMAKNFDHKLVESQIYAEWENSGAFAPNLAVKGKSFTIVLPPPNASGKMHMGNVLMIAIEDLMIRYHRMKGDPTLWIPGTDHAGFETQITYERELKKQGKSRFDFDRTTLYQNIWEFVQNNKSQIEGQIKQMGASVDWSRYTFTLDPQVVSTVYDTFAKMHKEGLVYRDNYMVNYCPKCGTTFADLEILHEERIGKLYYIKYATIGETEKYITVATTRPETIMLDTHIAVNPKDKKRMSWIGKKVINPLTNKEMEILGDQFVDPKFGTGFVKLTPAHDKNDYEAGKKHGLPFIVGIGMDGRMTSAAGKWAGKSVFTARQEVVAELSEKGLMEKIDEKYNQSVAVCYKGGHEIEPMVLPNWFVKVESLKKPALEAVTSGKVKIFPKWREITYTKWMEEMHDWPISRQVVWGIRIPVWYKIDSELNKDIQVTFLSGEKEVVAGNIRELLQKYNFDEISDGLQTLIAPKGAEMVVAATSPGEGYLQETDTFDTWFSSGHWPLVTLKYPDSEDFSKFYPTSVLETGWEIIRFWVSRMIMFGIYLTGKPPFEYVYLHGLVRALDGRKMSKSLGNVINPDEYMEKYGVDALRMGLISGTANGKDFAFPKDRIVAYRNFANKLWNMTRFFLMMQEKSGIVLSASGIQQDKLQKSDTEILGKLKEVIKSVDDLLEKFRFAEAAETIYHFMWDEVAAKYIESLKDREDQVVALPVLQHILINGLKLLHPFMPFVTEAIWKEFSINSEEQLITASWPSA